MQLPSPDEANKLGIYHLNRFYTKNMAIRAGALSADDLPDEWALDTTLLSALNIGLEQMMRYLYTEAPTFQVFEDWILELNDNNPDPEKIELFNASQKDLKGALLPTDAQPSLPLDEADLLSWEKNGYVIVRNAISKEACAETLDVICQFMQMDIADPATWYLPHPAKQGIMIQFFQHPTLERNRTAPRIKEAFRQVWQRNDLWPTTDRVSFNPPENTQWHFPGPALHWDVSLDLPIPFGTQGLLYLSDTQQNQGAFTLVPGFHHRIAGWIGGLPSGADPRRQNLYDLGAQPIAAGAGDFIIWHQALPHGSSPNTAALPRIVQYINYAPLEGTQKRTWK